MNIPEETNETILKTPFSLLIALHCALLSSPTNLAAQLPQKEIGQLTELRTVSAAKELIAFLKIPNNGRLPNHVETNATWCLNTFQKLGFDTKIVSTVKGPPHVFAQKIYDDRLSTILFYLQIDGQPVDSTQWNQADPYTPVLKRRVSDEWQVVDQTALTDPLDPEIRIFARSASDSKGPAIAFITALRILSEQQREPSFNIKVIMDFQEEIGSPTLPALVREQRELFNADAMLIMDGTRHLSNLPTLTFGARGIATISLKVFGAKNDLHSGHYGNFAPNPVFKLARLLAAMKDEKGKVLIPGFYDDVELTEEDKAALHAVPEDLDEIKKSLGVAAQDAVGETYQEALQFPSLNVRGLRAAWTGDKIRTIIPAEAVAEIDMRLVPETPGERMVELVRQFIIDQGFHIVDSEPTDEERLKYPNLIAFSSRIGSKPFRTDMHSELGNWLSRAMAHLFEDRFVKMRSTGGSQPIAPFISELNIPAVSIRIPNPDNNIHAPNENLRLGNFLEGIRMCLSILTRPLVLDEN